ncbi:MAG: hypothetical protein V4542_01670 [Pseudomonadota bacterium]
MTKTWTNYAVANSIALTLSKRRNEPVDLVRVEEGWQIPSYCSWLNELNEIDPPHLNIAVDDIPSSGLAAPLGESLTDGFLLNSSIDSQEDL